MSRASVDRVLSAVHRNVCIGAFILCCYGGENWFINLEMSNHLVNDMKAIT